MALAFLLFERDTNKILRTAAEEKKAGSDAPATGGQGALAVQVRPLSPRARRRP